MASARIVSICLLLTFAGCAPTSGVGPSLAPRSAEAIDPRVPVRPSPDQGSVDPALAARLSALVAEAQRGDRAFEDAAANARRLAGAADAPQSESWVVAQQALSAAVAAREPTTRALADIDEVAATALATQGGIAPAHLAAIQVAAAEVSRIDRRQAATIDALQARLGS